MVAGAGGGLAGAVRAAELGLRVLVVEVSPHFAHGNNTSMSTAMVPAAGTPWQAAAGIEDSPELFLGDIMRKTNGEADATLAASLAAVSARLVNWLAEDVGLPMELATDIAYPGHGVFRCHTVPRRKGSVLLDGLVERASSQSAIDLLVPARLLDVHERAGRLEAALVGYPDGSEEEIACRAVLLATNGFGASRELVRRHIPEIADAVYHGSAESRGDALRIGVRHGADTAYLDAYQGHGALASPHGTLVGWATVMHGGYIVNEDGHRFGDETTGYSEFAREVIAERSATAVLVLDRRIHDACVAFDDFRATVECGAIRWSENADELAASFRIDPGALKATLAEVADVAGRGGSDRFGRRWRDPAPEPPYAAVRVTGALFHTQGGLRVDADARVLRPGGSPIVGLYASGGAAMGISGHGPAGYLAGNGLLPALGLAFVAAEHIARGP